MRVVIISFDSLEYDLIRKFDNKVLIQKEYGQLGLETYFRDRGRDPRKPPKTTEIYASFVAGIIPEDYVELYREFDKLYKTIFQLAPLDAYGRPTAIAIDVPAYNRDSKAWIDLLTGYPLFVRYWEGGWPIEVSEKEYYKYMDIKASYAGLIRLLGYDLIMFYFKEPDKLHHAYMDYEKDEPKIRKLYRKCEDIAEHIIEVFSDEETLFIIFSDHGVNLRGGHSNHGFWSSNKSLGRGQGKDNVIDLVDWFNIIKEWYEAPVKDSVDKGGYTDKEKEKLIEHLKTLGYME